MLSEYKYVFLTRKIKNYKNSMSQTDSTYYEKMKIYLYLLKIIQCQYFVEPPFCKPFLQALPNNFQFRRSCCPLQNALFFFFFINKIFYNYLLNDSTILLEYIIFISTCYCMCLYLQFNIPLTIHATLYKDNFRFSMITNTCPYHDASLASQLSAA